MQSKPTLPCKCGQKWKETINQVSSALKHWSASPGTSHTTHYLSSALDNQSFLKPCCGGAGLQLPVHAPYWSGLWPVCGPPGLVADLSGHYGPVWQSLDCVWPWPMDWPPSLTSDLCHHHELAWCWGLVVEAAPLSRLAAVGLALILPSAPASLSCWKKTQISQGK